MSNEANAGFELVAAFQAYDAEAAERILKEQVFTFLQVEVARIARKLRVPTIASTPAAVPAPPMAAPSSASSQPAAGYTVYPAPVAAPDAAASEQPSPEPAVAQQPPPEPTAQNLGELLM